MNRVKVRRREVALLSFLLLLVFAAGASGDEAARPTWPAKLGEAYPDLRLIDQNGARTALSSFRGKVIVVEPVGMSCPACQAFAGANRQGVGTFGGGRAQRGLKSFDEYLADHGIKPDHPDLVHVHLLLFDPNLKVPTPEQAQAWARHFGMDRTRNRVVLAGEAFMTAGSLYKPSYKLVPGFQLVDRDFVLRIDATGHSPRHDVWKEFFPELRRLLE